MTALAETFISALRRLESERDADTIAGLFAEDASISNPLVSYEAGGAVAARRFWAQYRAAFEEISSEFRTVKETDGVAFLEWRSRGTLAGEAFDYGGVSVLEEADGKIASFRTYFDSAQLPRAHAPLTHTAGDAAPTARPDIAPPGKNKGGEDLDRAQRAAAEQRAEGGYS
ncbi:ketosteroid isomerase-like protein [Rhizobium sp. PP-F2F-G48]|uniref:nuclear transport factor 2 family protein n=1 Tax=Rhizobium sp. PP-F2F-G48 TaxID=2135651 RepID=UPI0010479EA6|nr:nuclear transport factor 2 family protein [Rhizobium sp. PP-F2F-G48]TCM58799.1 ketosteroid isomerase-like protein [Rhizobium sp. PP-F2F-G48]